MLTMTEKTLVGLVVTLGFVFTASLILPVWTYEARLSTSPSSSNISAPQGRPFNVTCQGDSNVNGQFKNMKWLNPKGEKISTGVEQVGNNKLLLTIEDPKETDSGVYKCLAVYENKNMEIHVSVIFYGPSPRFESGYEVVQVVEGEKAELWCEANGEGPITYEWLDQNEEKISPGSNPTMHISSTGNGSVLTIDRVRLDQDGTYMCTASNPHGLSNKLYELRVTSADRNDTALVLNVRTTKITATSIGFDLSVSEQVFEIEVKYVESEELVERSATFKPGEVYEVNGLIPGGKYSFQFRTTSMPDNVTSGWTDKYDVTLLPPKPDAIIRSLSGNSLQIEWMRPIDDIMRGTTDKYQLSYYRIQIIGGRSWEKSSCVITVELPSCLGSSHTLSGLSNAVYYELELRAHSVSGFGEAYTVKFYLPNN